MYPNNFELNNEWPDPPTLSSMSNLGLDNSSHAKPPALPRQSFPNRATAAPSQTNSTVYTLPPPTNFPSISSLASQPSGVLTDSSRSTLFFSRESENLPTSHFQAPLPVASPVSFDVPQTHTSTAQASSEVPSHLIDSTSTLHDSTEGVDVHAPTVIDSARLDVDFEDPTRRIGIGTYGAVYVGTYFGQLVAVKRIQMPSASAAVIDDPHVAARRQDAIRQFAKHIRRYERVSHPGIVRFLGVTLPPDASALIITELMPGGSLGAALNTLRKLRIPLKLSSTLRIALHACGGLRALHGAKCTWGDAKPENILLSSAINPDGDFPPNGEARIADFGLSRSVGQSLLADTTISGTAQPIGTFNYMAPETMAGEDAEDDNIAKASDIYSFGLIVYEMLTLRTPWKRTQPMEVNRRVMKGERPSWPTKDDNDFYYVIPEELRELVERCWCQKYVDRPSADEVFNTLEDYHIAFTKTDETLQRPVSDIMETPRSSVLDFSSIPRVQSSKSNASTAIAIGDSVEIPPEALEGNTSQNSLRYNSGDLALVNDGSALLSLHDAGPPRVSPVTSPEPSIARPLAGKDASNLDRNCVPFPSPPYRKDQRDLMQLSLAGSSGAESGNGQYFGNVSHPATHPDYGRRDVGLTNPNDASKNLSNESASAHFHANLTGNARSHNADFQPTSDLALLRSRPGSGSPPREVQESRTHQRNELPSASSPLIATLDGSIQELASSTASTGSQRRRAKKLQTLVERAVESYLETQRREEQEKIPPKQRRDVAEKKALQEAKVAAESKALSSLKNSKNAGDFSAILDIMKQHRDSHAVAKTSLSLLVPFCSDENLYFDLCEEDGVEEMVSAVCIFGEIDANACVLFCQSMTALSEHYDDKVGHLLRGVGVPSLVVEILDFHRTNISVQTAGCDCLAVIAGTSELSRSAVATLGGPAVVYRAMTKNNSSFKDVELARAALRAVRQIAQDNEKAAEYLVQVAALDTVSRSAEVFTDHGLEVDILTALRSFSFYNGGRRNIIMSSGLKALTAIMLRNRDPDFLVQCCTFIRAIARWRDRECEDAMLQSCISERITTLMQMSSDIPGEEGARVAWYSCHACTFLASFGSRSRQRLRLVGAIETAIGVLNKRKENARVVHSATDALAELIKDEQEAKSYAEECDAVKALSDALQLHSSIVKVRTALQWTLDYLTSTKGTTQGPAYGSRVYNELMSNVNPTQANANAEGFVQRLEQKPTRKFMGFKFLRKHKEVHG